MIDHTEYEWKSWDGWSQETASTWRWHPSQWNIILVANILQDILKHTENHPQQGSDVTHTEGYQDLQTPATQLSDNQPSYLETSNEVRNYITMNIDHTSEGSQDSPAIANRRKVNQMDNKGINLGTK